MRLSPQALARACSRRPWRTIAAWIVTLVVAVGVVGTLLGGRLESEQRLTNNPESYRGQALLDARLPNANAVDEVVVVRSERYTVDRPQFRTFVRTLIGRIRATNAIADVRSFLDGNRSLVSRDRHAAILPTVMGDDPETGITRVLDVVEQTDRDPNFSVAITGTWTIDHDFNELALNDLKKGEAFFGAPAALVILVLVFGALAAAGMPLLLALVSILVALGLVTLVAQIWVLSIFVQNMLTAVGLALGIDYSLFVLSRYREERTRGMEPLDAIAAAGATASRAVFFSGSAFVIALSGMLLVPDNIMRSLAAGAILVGIVSVAAALTLLPAVLGLLGDRVNALRVPVIGRAVDSAGREGRFWSRAAHVVMGRPVVSLVAAAALLLAAAAPVLDFKTGFASVSTFPDGFASKRGLEALERDFRGGQADPVEIVVEGDVQQVRPGVRRLRAVLKADGRFGPVSVRTAPRARLTVISSPLPGGATDPAPVSAVRQLRSDYVPRAFAGVSGAHVYVAGETAQDVDYFDTMSHWLPIVVAFVLGLSFVLLTIVFRSIVLPLKAILLNLLSVGAAYGLVVLVFEKGFGNQLLGFQHVDSIVAWVPLFLFSVLFGLSMDYHVFLLTRIRERFLRSGDNTEAVTYGVGTTARLITGAALIIVVVFIGFSTGDLVMFQQMGFGVAVALLLDATIVRSVLVPASMKLLGRWNWYLPSWLEWLPELHVEGGPALAAQSRAR